MAALKWCNICFRYQTLIFALGGVDWKKKDDGTPLDLALHNKHSQIVRALAARQAPLQVHSQGDLDMFLRQNPLIEHSPPGEEKKAAEWIQQVYEQMDKGVLLPMDDSAIRQALRRGILPAGWSPNFAWPSIQRRAEEHEIARRSQQYQLARECDHLDEAPQPPPMADMSSVLQFTSRVIPIEQELVGQLEGELNKQKPHLAALDDNTLPQQPKLSLMLNCMGIDAAGIAATSSLNLAQFIKKTKRGKVSSKVNRSTNLDLLYCGQLMPESSFPFVRHEDECPVCGNRTSEELIHFVKGRDIHLNEQLLREKEINGRRVLFCTKKDFPNQSKDQLRTALGALQALHEEHL